MQCGIAKLVLALCFLPLMGQAKTFKNYEYDAVGNIVSIKQVDPSLAIYSFSPAAGPADSIVTIHGNLFSSVADQNSITFNDVSAPILSATETTLIVRVPQNATTGPVSVAVQDDVVYSENDFIVADEGGGPVIYDFSPKCGAKGAAVSVSGDRFDLDNAATLAGIEGNLTAADVANIRELSFSIPTTAATGRVRVITPLGAANSSDILLIPPTGSGITCADDAALSRNFLSVGETSEISYTENQKYVLFFDAEENDLLTFNFTGAVTNPAVASIAYAVYDPQGTRITSSSFSTSEASAHLPIIPTSGIYTVIFSASHSSPASFSVALVQDPLVSIDGDSLAIETHTIGHSKRIGFYAEEGQSLGFSLQQLAYGNSAAANSASNIQLYRPDGKAYTSYSYIGSSSVCYLFRGRMCDLDLPAINQAGLYTVVIRPATNTTIQTEASVVSNIQVSLNDGQPLTLNLNKIGQNAWLDFEGTAGENVSLSFTDVLQLDQEPLHALITVYVYKPNDAFLNSTSIKSTANQLNLGTLPETGSYRILISPSYGSRASMTVMLNGGE